jgi:hypothetical protein
MSGETNGRPLVTRIANGKERRNVNGKKDTKKKGTLRPWLVDVSLDHLR